jgi:hypothetical protein
MTAGLLTVILHGFTRSDFGFRLPLILKTKTPRRVGPGRDGNSK